MLIGPPRRIRVVDGHGAGVRAPGALTTWKLLVPDLLRTVLDVVWKSADLPELARIKQARRGQGRILSDEQLAEVAAVCRDNPNERFAAVKKRFNIARSTAADYIDRARDAGHDVADGKAKR
jgi:hypothetical protein